MRKAHLPNQFQIYSNILEEWEQMRISREKEFLHFIIHKVICLSRFIFLNWARLICVICTRIIFLNWVRIICFICIGLIVFGNLWFWRTWILYKKSGRICKRHLIGVDITSFTRFHITVLGIIPNSTPKASNLWFANILIVTIITFYNL